MTRADSLVALARRNADRRQCGCTVRRYGRLKLRAIRRALLGAGLSLLLVALAFAALIVWPKPLFAYALHSGKLVIASDEPIPDAAGRHVIQDCEALLARSPLPPRSSTYHVFVTNTPLRHRVFFLVNHKAGGLTYFVGGGGNAFLSGADFVQNRLVKWGYVTPPPRTFAYFCAHELTHVVTAEFLGVIASERQPAWVHEGFADYVGFADREGFEALRAAVADRPVDAAMMQNHGAYPRYRMLVMYFLEKKGWPIERLLRTRLTFEDALAMLREDSAR
jgi:hypothetical protein